MNDVTKEDKGGFVSLLELLRYVQRAVPNTTHGQQTLVVGGNYDGNMAVEVIRCV